MTDASGIRERIAKTFEDSARVQLDTAARSSAAIAAAAALMCSSLEAGGKVLVFGNGGSAADSQHFAAELVGRFAHDRRPLSAVALTTDTSIITAVANDYAYEEIFVRQVIALGRRGDVALGISTSGRSPSVVRAIAAAKECGLSTVAIVGCGSDGAADVTIAAASSNTARIQEAHRTILHALCAVIENELAPLQDH